MHSLLPSPSALAVITLAVLSGLSAAAPPAPTNFTATPGDGQVVLSWDASPGATTYTVYRDTLLADGYSNRDAATTGYDGFAVLASGLTGTSYTDMGLTNGDGYYYYVTASNGVPGESDRSVDLPGIPQPAPPNPGMGSFSHLIPKPVSVQPTGGEFVLGSGADIYVSAEAGVLRTGEILAEAMRPATGYQLDVVTTGSPPAAGNIYLVIDAGYESGKPEAYQLEITSTLVTIRANSNTGLYWGTQTLRQVFPWQIEYQGGTLGGATWRIPTGVIDDYPRFSHRGDLWDLSVYLPLEELKRLVDRKAYYKKNAIQLKFRTGQGWRMSFVGIDPEYTADLADEFYTEAEMAELSAYAEERHVKLYPQFKFETKSGGGTPSYIQFLTDACAAVFNGPYFHNGANPDDGTAPAQAYVTETEAAIEASGLITIGWQEMGMRDMSPNSMVQQWRTDWFGPEEAIAQGNKILVSNAYNAYYDMAYNPDTWWEAWAGRNPTDDCYNWEPTMPDGPGGPSNFAESDVLGVEGIHFVRTTWTKGEVYFMGWPRSLGIDELSWSPRAGRSWDEFKARLGQHGNRLVCKDIIFYESPLLTWDLWHSPLPDPTGLVAVGAVGQVDLDWSDVITGDFDSYQVYRSTTQGGPYAQIATGLTESSYTDATTTDGTIYYYVVSSVDTGLVESGYSNEASVRPPVAPQLANATASEVGSATATLNGSVIDTGGELPEITIFWGDNDGGTGTWDNSVNLAFQDVGAFSAELSGLLPGTTYYYRAFGENSAGTDWASATESFTTLPATPGAPTGLAALAGIAQVALAWDDSTLPDFASFSVYRSSVSGSGYALLASGLGESSYTDTAVSSGETWHYVVTVENTLANESPQSGEASGTVGSGSASIFVNLDSEGRTTGGGYNNGHIFGEWSFPSVFPGSVTGGATTTQTVGWDYDTTTDTGTMTMQVDDRGWGGSGAVFTFDLEVYLFNDGPGISDVNAKTGGSLSADSRNMENIDGQTEAAPSGGGREYNTLRITNITSISGPAVSFGGLDGLMIKWINNAGDAGIIYAEGDATKTVIGSWDDSEFKRLVPAGGLAAATLEPTGDGFGLQGFTASFEVISGAVVAPEVANSPATSVNPTSATLNGQVTSTGGNVPDVTIYYGTTDPGPTTSGWDDSVSLGAQSASLSQGVSGLLPETTYFYRCYAANSAGTDIADPAASFTTPQEVTVTAPTVVNAPAGGVGVTVATLNGEVTDTGGEAPVVTIYYGTTDPGPTAAGWEGAVSVGGGAGQSGTFAETITGLSASTTYHYRAYAQNSGGSDWADNAQSFTTGTGGGGGQPVPFTVLLDTNNDLTGGTANGSVWGAGGGTTERDGITSVNTTGYPGNGATATISFTAEVTDPGHELFGLKVGYDVVAAAFTDNGAGNISPSTVDLGGGLGIKSSLAGQQDNEIDAASKLSAGGAFEFLRMSLANVSVLADPNNVLNGGTVTADGFVGHTIRHQGETPNAPTGEGGRALQAGTATVLGTWGPDAEGYRAVFQWTMPNSTDIVADGEEGSLQGFRARFTATPAGGAADPFDDWADSFTALTNPDVAFDFDRGGLPTGIEWVTGGDPTDGGDDGGQAPTIDNSDPDDFLFIFARSDEAEADANTSIAVEYGSSLTTWRNTIDHGMADGVVTTVENDGFGPGIDRVTVAIPRSLEVNGTLFARLKVTIAIP